MNGKYLDKKLGTKFKRSITIMYWNLFPIIIQKLFNNKKQPYVYCMSLNNKKRLSSFDTCFISSKAKEF